MITIINLNQKYLSRRGQILFVFLYLLLDGICSSQWQILVSHGCNSEPISYFLTTVEQECKCICINALITFYQQKLSSPQQNNVYASMYWIFFYNTHGYYRPSCNIILSNPRASRLIHILARLHINVSLENIHIIQMLLSFT